ncbi:hypothetical protein ACFQ7B_36150 [Streptomyces erythrochromogenes]|uniref:hypothetical protein n=1 Tax=Streptomyces erythrochromogenes TaxID=285574 RepID=UPI0036B2D02A
MRRATVPPSGASLVERRELALEIAGGPVEGGGSRLTSDELHRTPFAAVHEAGGAPWV